MVKFFSYLFFLNILIACKSVELSVDNGGGDDTGDNSGDGHNEPSACRDFESLDVGLIDIVMNENNARVDWENSLASTSDSLTVTATGPSGEKKFSLVKPALFNNLSAGQWNFEIRYTKSGCRDISENATQMVAGACESWDGLSLEPLSTNVNGKSVSIDWTAPSASFQSFEVTIIKNFDQQSLSNQKPANFSNLEAGNYNVRVEYFKNGCNPLSSQSQFTISQVSFAMDVYPKLSTTCLGCHGSSGGYAVGASVSAAYSNLTNQAPNRSCSSSPQNPSKRLVPGQSATQSFFYRKLSTNSCGQKMDYLSNEDNLMIRDWINQGALNN